MLRATGASHTKTPGGHAATGGCSTVESRKGSLGLFAAAYDPPHDQGESRGAHANEQPRACADGTTYRGTGTYFHCAQAREACEGSRGGSGSRPCHDVVLDPNLHGQSGEVKRFLGLPEPFPSVARAKRPGRQQTPPGLHRRKVDDDAVAIATDVNLLAVNGKAEISKNL
jgi:hypothetical protein